MATLTKITKFRRKLRRKRAGRDRKKQLEANGSTPAFPIHTPEVDAACPPAQVAPKRD
ncbi:MAG: hypothetical protein KTR31_39605 [Myxococcales bacterium]|nr:hypothetical protein [Myxococcales bacterium]